MKQRTLWLVKSRDSVCCHCRCKRGLISGPDQLDCPWCGCGWLFSCLKCRRAFTFARACTVTQTIEELARADWIGAWERDPTKKELADWTEALREFTSDLEEGSEYVYLDGVAVPVGIGPVEFVGICKRHRLDTVPHMDALSDPSVIERTLSNPSYWKKRRHPRKGQTR